MLLRPGWVRRAVATYRGNRTDRESGSALAAVVGILAVTGVVATALLTMTMFATGHTSAGRAGVQAEAAAEGGIDYARATLATTCMPPTVAGGPGLVLSPPPPDPPDPPDPSSTSSPPAFEVRIWYRATDGGWVGGCPGATPTEVRLRSTGFAAHPGVAGHDRGDAHTMEAVVTAATNGSAALTRAVVGDRKVTIKGLGVVTTVIGDMMSTNGDFHCGATVVHSGSVYVGGKLYRDGLLSLSPCLGLGSPKAFEPAHPSNVFPRITAAAAWPHVQRSTWSDLTGTTGAVDPNACGFALVSVVTVHEPTRVDCPGKLTVTGAVVLYLGADLVLFVDEFTVPTLSALTVVSLDGQGHSLSIVQRWPADRSGGCPATSPTGIRVSGSVETVGTSLLLYSGAAVSVDSPDVVMSGPIYGCEVKISGLLTTLTYAPVGPAIPASGRQLVSLRDLPPGS